MLRTIATRTIVAAVMLLMSVAAWSQELSAEMASYAAICLKARNAVQQRDSSAVGETITLYDEFFMRHAVANLDITGGESEELLAGHLQFEPAFLDTLLTRGLDLSVMPAERMGSGERGPATMSPSLYCADRVVPAKSKQTYRMTGTGHMELCVVAERQQSIFVTARCDGGMAEAGSHCARGDDGVAACTWDMTEAGEISITIENPSDEDLSCLIITN